MAPRYPQRSAVAGKPGARLDNRFRDTVSAYRAPPRSCSPVKRSVANDKICFVIDATLFPALETLLAVARTGSVGTRHNAVFWLAKMEPMIAISPAAMEVARIEPMGEGTLKFWRIGGLLVGLPGLVVLAGAAVYFARRD